MLVQLSQLPADAAFDVVVVGAGGAGMAAALYAAIGGARVLLVERTEYVGGTTALSGGTTWVPGTRHAGTVTSGLAAPDTLECVAGYLDRTVGDRAPRALRQALLANGPAAIERLETKSDVHFRAYAKHPDYESDIEGATLAGRALEPLPFDGRRLGPLFGLVRPPIPEFTVLGGMMVDRNDINHLLAITRSRKSFRHGAGLLLRHLGDRLRHPRGTRLVMGNALVGRLLYSLSKQPGVSIATCCSLESIERAPAAGPVGAGGQSGRVDAVTLVQGGERRSVTVRRALILASGGFNRHPGRRGEMLPGIDAAWCPGAPGHTGAAQDRALAIGATFGRGGLSHAFWAPVSTRKRPDGSTAVFPHFLMDRAKPGMLTVDATGRRFVNESTSYHRFGLAMQRDPARSIPAFLVCDAQALRQYGIGMVRPGGKGLAPFLADGYLMQGDTIEALAARIGVPAANLKATVERMNGFAESGVDGEFERGTTDYQRNIGDAAWRGRNPNLGPIAQAPFYAVRLYPGDIGAATGLATDEHARVLDADDRPIPGLYACGNDMHSVMGGVYAGPGITIGPGLVFASIAVDDALGPGGPGGPGATATTSSIPAAGSTDTHHRIAEHA